MTPKEKAIQLVDKFEHQYDLLNDKNIGIKGIDFEMAIQCALITVDEILSNAVDYNAYDGVSGFDMWIDNEYWQEVKQEIEKL